VPGDQNRIDLTAAAGMIGNHWRFRLWHVDINAIDSSAVHSYRDLVTSIVTAYAEQNGKKHPGIWVDHTPRNIEYISTLLEIFPDLKFIHLVRDGRAVASSVIPLDWGPNTVYRAAYSWMEKISLGLSVESLLGQDRILRVEYNTLVENPMSTIRDICSFLAIDYQPEMIEGKGFNVPKFQSEEHALVGKKPDATRVNAWEKALTPRQVEIFESIAGSLLQRLGYSLKYRHAKRITFMEKILSEIQEVYRRKIVNKIRRYFRNRTIPGSCLSFAIFSAGLQYLKTSTICHLLQEDFRGYEFIDGFFKIVV
jgi:hypothetical protein